MAPQADAAKNLHAHRQRPTGRTIVPAIPLPYIQKRKQNAAAAKKVDEEPVLSPPDSDAPAPSPPAPVDVFPVVDASSDVDVGTEVDKSTSSDAAATPETQPELKKEQTEDVQITPTDTPIEEQVESTPPLTQSDNQSSEPRSTYSMPPPFVPANHGYSLSTSEESVKFPKQPSFPGQHPMHHAHPSAGSLVFGGYPESNNSSPAPPLSAGGVAQYPAPSHPDSGRVQPPQYSNGSHMHTFSNGFPPLGPSASGAHYPRQDNYGYHNAGSENLPRRQIVSFGPPDNYSPSGTPAGVDSRLPSYDPSTPHSFHGSQSSAPNEQEGGGPSFYNHFPTAVISNGSNGNVEDVRLYHQARPKGRNGSQPGTMGQGSYVQPNMAQPPMPPNMDNLDGLLIYLQSQFADPQFADYTLELRYSDDRATPVRIPGHNLLFARSPTLKNLMTAQAREPNDDGLALRTLFIESDDRFLRSDGFWLAVHRLYGGPLLDPGASPVASIPAASHLSSAMTGTPADRFDLALGYSAAGHILQMPPVINRGIDIASHFINWLTIEKALDFALDGGLDSQWTLEGNHGVMSPSTYGPAVNMLIHSALNFIITTFPPNLDLDTMAPEPEHNHRLPAVVESRPALSNPRLSSIKFGDHPSEENLRSSNTISTSATLSKVLLNLPFQLLKYVLESSRLGNVHGWATTTLRQNVMHTVIEEREKRRNKIRDSQTVSNAERTTNRKQWEAVGWQESLVPPYGTGEPSALTRTWVDFLLPSNN